MLAVAGGVVDELAAADGSDASSGAGSIASSGAAAPSEVTGAQ